VLGFYEYAHKAFDIPITVLLELKYISEPSSFFKKKALP
jgi:hypothetical protein